jgi:cbb3-type cytochrome oxidase subunit 1
MVVGWYWGSCSRGLMRTTLDRFFIPKLAANIRPFISNVKSEYTVIIQFQHLGQKWILIWNRIRRPRSIWAKWTSPVSLRAYCWQVLREEVRPIKSEIVIYDFRNFNLYKVRKFIVQNTPKSNVLSKNYALLLILKVTKNRYIFNNSN